MVKTLHSTTDPGEVKIQMKYNNTMQYKMVMNKNNKKRFLLGRNGAGGWLFKEEYIFVAPV